MTTLTVIGFFMLGLAFGLLLGLGGKKTTCSQCTCLLQKRDAKFVLGPIGYRGERMKTFYCSRCLPVYQRWSWVRTHDFDTSRKGPKFESLVPEHWVRVNEDGTPWEEKE